MILAGTFNRRVRIERQGDGGTLDDYGNPAAAAWETYLEVWADLREVRGKERIASGRIEGPLEATIRLRASSDTRAITVSDRILEPSGRIWAITGGPIDPTGRRQVVEFTLEAGGAVQ